MTTNTRSWKTETRIGKFTAGRVQAIVESATEPLLMAEVQTALVRSGMNISRHTVTRALFELSRDGRIFSRLETPAEREIRNTSQRGQVGARSILYFGKPNIPARRSLEVLTGIVIPLGKNSLEKKTRPAKAAVKQTGTLLKTRPAKGAEMQTGNRIARLEARVAELETMVKNLVKELH